MLMSECRTLAARSSEDRQSRFQSLPLFWSFAIERITQIAFSKQPRNLLSRFMISYRPNLGQSPLRAFPPRLTSASWFLSSRSIASTSHIISWRT